VTSLSSGTSARLLAHDEEMPAISSDELSRFVREVLMAAGVPAEAAEITSCCLVSANLRGVDSHGVRLLPSYITQLRAGDMDANAAGAIVTENGACLVYDAQNGIGQVSAAACCDHAVRIAGKYGIGFVTARNANHFGAAAYWGSRIAGHGSIAMVACNASRLVAPWQGREPRMGTNPICMAVPAGWLLDMSTTAVAANKIFSAIDRKADSIPDGWALDRSGAPTNDPHEGLKGSVMPLGGAVAGHKGSGLAAAVEILTAVLSGGPMMNEIGSMRQRGKPVGVSHIFLAIDVERLMPLAQFRARMDRFTADLKSSLPAEGYDEVLVAGEPEWRIERQRQDGGIPLPPEVWNALARTASELGVSAPGATV
jgi:LDH2 family malate/lactate/ureidoglycolate dehydrogenase